MYISLKIFYYVPNQNACLFEMKISLELSIRQQPYEFL